MADTEATVFGMNTVGVPWMEYEYGTALVALIMVVISLGTLVYFRSKRWL